jgi:tRNA(adenine34) deaminase
LRHATRRPRPLAIEVAEEGIAEGELPIGAVVLTGDRVIGRSHTSERSFRRRIVHVDLLAMLQADEQLGFARSSEPLTLAVNLEPCLMCLGAALTLGVDRVWFGRESPGDGASCAREVVEATCRSRVLPQTAQHRRGFHRTSVQEQFARYAAGTGPQAMRDWCRDLSQLSPP